MRWEASRNADGALAITARNDGNAHARIHRFAVKDTTRNAIAFEQPALAYVLPGAIRQWTFDDNKNNRPNAASMAPVAVAGPFRLEGTTDRGAFATELIVQGR